MTDLDIMNTIRLLSTERLATVRKITNNDVEAIKLHHQMLSVASALMPVTAILEICLRNAIDEKLKALFGIDDWLQNPPTPFIWKRNEATSIKRAKQQMRKAAYAKKNQYEKSLLDSVAYPNGLPPNLSHQDRVSARRNQIPIISGQLITQLTLTFWKSLLSSDYETSLWNTSLKKIFPDKSIKRSHIAREMEVIYQTRNRIAHHEPVYGKRLVDTLSAIEYIITNFGDKNAQSKTLVERMLVKNREALNKEVETLKEMIRGYQ